MDTLKMKFKLHGLEFELEGNEATVKTEFESFKAFTMDILSKVNIQNEQTTILPPEQKKSQISLPPADSLIISNGSYPDITNVVRKHLPAKEWEWVLVYTFYTSNFGENDITRDSIREMYKTTKRDAKQNLLNLTQNLNSIHQKGYIAFLNENDFQLLDQGIDEAINIISRTTSSPSNNNKKTTIKPQSVKKQRSNNTSKLEKISDLNLAPENIISLDDFYKQNTIITHYEKILLFVHYLEEVLKIKGVIAYNHIYTCYDWLGIAFPESFTQTVSDLKRNKGWIEGNNSLGFKTSLKGKNYFRQTISKDNNGK